MVEQGPQSLSEATKALDRARFIRSVPHRANEITRDPAFLQYTRDHIDEFRRRVAAGGYSESDYRFIHGALDLAIVAYQDNQHVALRQRKQTVRYNNEDVNIPYIEHPLSVAAAMIGDPRQIRLHASDSKNVETIDINVRQDPYKAEVIVAALLHDVFEDSKIKMPSGGVVEGHKAWTGLMREYFDDIDNKSANSVLTMINAVTKYATIPKGLLAAIKESTVFGTVSSLIERQGIHNKSAEDVENEVARSLSDLHKMVATCFGVGGDTHFDEESFTNFFGALAIKCHDVENNLEDSKVREDKLVRAHILAAFARVYGLPVASRMAAHLIVSNRFDMFWGIGNRERNLKEGRETVRLYGEFEGVHHRPVFTVAGQELKVDALQIPILTEDEIAPPEDSNGDEFRSVLQYRMTVRDTKVMDRIESAYNKANEYNPVQISYMNEGCKEEYIGYPIREQAQTEILDSTRKCYYFKVYGVGTGRNKQKRSRLAGIYRIQDNQPSAHAVLKLGSKIVAKSVPENSLIEGKYDGDPASCMEIFSIVSSSHIN